MKRTLVIVSLAALALLLVFTLACCVLPVSEWGRANVERCMLPPCDFRLRLNEISCLRDGVNPFDVWNRKIVKAPYFSLHHPEDARGIFTEPINAYTPWEYTMAMPFTFVPRRVAWGAYVLLMFLSLGVLMWGGYRIGRKTGKDRLDGILFAVLPVLAVFYPIWSNFCIGNYAVPILASIFMMCWCLDRGYDVWAGVFWAFAMIKPQNSLLLAVPLMMRAKFTTCIVAAGVCLVASLPSAFLCKTSVVDLILQAPAAGASGFHGCATMPSFFCGFLGNPAAIALAALIGLSVCVFMTVKMRQATSWHLFVVPAVICSISWSYTTSYSYALAWFLFVGVLGFFYEFRSRMAVALICAAILLLPRFYTCWHGFASVIGCCRASDDVSYAVESIISLLVLALTVVFCFLVRKSSSLSEGVENP